MRRKRVWAALVVIGLVGWAIGIKATPGVAAAPADARGATVQQGDPAANDAFEVNLEFEALLQGQVGLVTVTGSGIAGARLRFLDRLIDCYAAEDTWHGLLGVNMEQTPNTYPLEVLVWFDDNTRSSWEDEVTITDGGFGRQDVTLSADLAYLLEPEVDRAERSRLEAIFNQVTPTRYWDGPFQKPLDAEFTSPFGAWRLYNNSLWGRHTGIDLRGPAGTPLLAPAAGRVVLAERLDVRGNYVLIDHGWGIYSGLAHLSEIHVTRGQFVRAGQVIGVSGSTGRSSGPHIHWEIAVDGEWVDPSQFIEIALP